MLIYIMYDLCVNLISMTRDPRLVDACLQGQKLVQLEPGF